MPPFANTLPRHRTRAETAEVPAPVASIACTARVVSLDPEHRVLVSVPGASAPTPARLLRGIRHDELFESDGKGAEVLVVFDAARDGQPVIVGLLQPETQAESVVQPEARAMRDRVLIEALAELVLKCGAGSITLRQDGKIILRGTHLLSRSSGPIRIKGGHVEIN